VFGGLKRLVERRKSREVFSGGEVSIIHTENAHVLGFERAYNGQRAVIFANFSEQEQALPPHVWEQIDSQNLQLLHGQTRISAAQGLSLPPLDFAIFA